MNNNIPSERVTLKGKILQNLKMFEKETPQKSLGRHNVNFRLNKFDQIYFLTIFDQFTWHTIFNTLKPHN